MVALWREHIPAGRDDKGFWIATVVVSSTTSGSPPSLDRGALDDRMGFNLPSN
jgi:hypothetical protein